MTGDRKRHKTKQGDLYARFEQGTTKKGIPALLCRIVYTIAYEFPYQRRTYAGIIRIPLVNYG